MENNFSFFIVVVLCVRFEINRINNRIRVRKVERAFTDLEICMRILNLNLKCKVKLMS